MPSLSSDRRHALMAPASGRFPPYRRRGAATVAAARNRWLKKMAMEKLKGHHTRKMAKLAVRLCALRSCNAKVQIASSSKTMLSAGVVGAPERESNFLSRRAANWVGRPQDEIVLLSVERAGMETEERGSGIEEIAVRASSETLNGDSVQVKLEEGIEGLDELSAPVEQELGRSEPELGHDQPVARAMAGGIMSDSEADQEEEEEDGGDMGSPKSNDGQKENDDDDDNDDWVSDGENVRDVITGDPITPKGILKDSMARYGRIRIELGLSGNEPIPSYIQGSGDRVVFWRAALADRRQRLREYQTRIGREIDYISHILPTFD